MAAPLLVQPKNTMPRIEKIWAYLSVDPVDGNEGVCAATLSPGLGPVPLIAADEARLKSLGPIAEEMARRFGMEIVLVEFTVRTEVRCMSDGTPIEWARHPVTGKGATWNPIVGCAIKSPGCKNCYAMSLAGSRTSHTAKYAGLTKGSNAGPVWTGEVRLWEPAVDQPLKWLEPRGIFVNSMGDLFAEGVPDEWIDRVFTVMETGRRHVYFVLSKRPDRMSDYLRRVFGADGALNPHIWVGASVERQPEADLRRQPLAELAAAGWTTFVSYEPALGPVDWAGFEFLAWLISGGESGKGARPSHPDWHRIARDFAAAHAIPYFKKQWGEWAPICALDEGVELYHPAPATRPFVTRLCKFADTVMHADGSLHDPRAAMAFLQGTGAMHMFRVGKQRAGRLLDGRTHDAMPGALRLSPPISLAAAAEARA